MHSKLHRFVIQLVMCFKSVLCGHASQPKETKIILFVLMTCNLMQLMVAAFITMTVFLRTQTKIDDAGANYFLSSLFYSLIRMTTQALPELPMTVSRLSIFYKQRDSYFYPAWAYSIPAAILKVPFSLLDAFIWCALTYYVIGYSPEPERYGKYQIV